MSILSRFAAISAAVALLAAPCVAHAAPPTPEQVVARHAEGVTNVVNTGTSAIANAGAAAVARIGELDAAGATDEAITRAGHRAVHRVGDMVRRSLEGVHKMTFSAVRVLSRIGAAEEFKTAVRTAAEAGASAIRSAGEAARSAIGAAVDAATSAE